MEPAIPEHLLEHAGWLRGLARALCRDEHAAADLEQETWLAALRGGAHARDARAWLGSVARRLAASSGRSEGRRSAREADVAGARPPEAPDGTEMLASVELSARLARAVAELDEPYRTTLALRYYEGLPPRRIAQRLGIDARAVESRLRRGREKLREALDGQCGGREVWFGTALALALAGGDHGGRVVALAATLLLLLGGGAAGVAIHRARPSSDPEPRAAAVLRAPEESTAPSVEISVAPLQAEPASGLRTSVTLPAAGLELVIEGDGLPLVGATVVWRDAQGRRQVQSDAAGRVAFAPVLGAPLLRIDVAATESTRWHRAEVPGNVLTRIFVPRRGGRLNGRTVDLAGQAVPFAEILAWRGRVRSVDLDHPDRRGATDEHGRFVFEDSAEESGGPQEWTLAAQLPGLATFAPLQGRCEPGRAEDEVVLVLEPAWEVFGRVIDGAGRALPGVPLVAFHSGGRSIPRDSMVRSSWPKWTPVDMDPRFERNSAEDGSFAFQVVGLEPESRESWRLQANSQHHPVALLEVERPGWIDLRLDWGTRLDGVVLDAARRPVSGARVGLMMKDRRTPAVTDASGRFSFDGLGHVRGGIVHVQALGHALSVQAVVLPNGDAPIEFVLEPECRIEGLVLDEFGEPVRSASVVFEGDRVLGTDLWPRSRGMQWEDACMVPMAHTDGSGRFRVDGLYPGRYVVQVAQRIDVIVRAYAQVELRPGEPTDPLVLRLGSPMPQALTVVGRVLDESGSTPELPELYSIVARRFVEGEREPIMDVVWGGVRPDASFSLSGLTPGRWSFGATRRGAGGASGTPLTESELYGPGVVDLGELRFVEAAQR